MGSKSRKVYLLRSNENYKIGIAKDVNKRIKQLQTGNPYKIELIGSYESMHASKIETTLHNQYSHEREMGEWFTLSLREEINFINECERIENNIKILNDLGNNFI